MNNLFDFVEAVDELKTLINPFLSTFQKCKGGSRKQLLLPFHFFCYCHRHYDIFTLNIMADHGWSKESIVDVIVTEPDRVTFASFSKKRPHLKKILVDKKSTLFVKCLKCADHICKYDSKKGSGPLIQHEKKYHSGDAVDEDDDEIYDEDLFPKQPRSDTKPKTKDPFDYPYMVWDHCTITGRKTAGGLDIRSCNYCSKDLGASPAYATIHMKECGMIPDEVREIFIHRTGRKKRKYGYDTGSDEEMGGDDDDDDDQQEKVVKILTGLLTKKGVGEMTKKPLRNFTESDFDRELKELAVKKARLEIRALEDGQREMEERCKMYQDIRKAVNVWMEKESKLIVVPHVKEMLQEAYENSIASQSVNGQH